MLGVGRYLLGVAEVGVLIGTAWLGAARVRERLLPELEGAPARLATGVLALALLIWVAELLGSFSLLEPVPYLFVVAFAGLGLWFALRTAIEEARATSPAEGVAGASWIAAAAALVIGLVAVVHFAGGVETRLGTGMTGFDSTWYHGPFAAGFFQSGDTWDLHFIAPQFLAWFYPANGEIFHGIGMLAFGRDVLSPLLNLGWLMGCLAACWCIGRPYRVAPWSLTLGAIALSVPALADQAGEARNDIVGIFFLLAAVALALNSWLGREEEDRGLSVGVLVVVGLAAGLAAGTKLNFLLPAAVLVAGLVAIAPRGGRGRALAASGLAALAGGGYWYLRNLIHAGNPLPWVDSLGPISLPAPDQALGGREAHSVFSYLTDGTVWSDWFLPGLRDGLWVIWPLLVGAALSGLLLAVVSIRPGRDPDSGELSGSGGKPWNGAASGNVVLAVAGAVGLAAALAWLVAPTSASGPEGMPHGFESGLRYLAPALVLGLALLPATRPLRSTFVCLAGARSPFFPDSGQKDERAQRAARRWPILVGLGLVLVAVAVGYPVQRHYLDHRYADPTFTTPGLNAAFAWSRDISDSRIATTSTRQYPLFGIDLSNHVQYVGIHRPHGGFEAPTTCQRWRHLLNEGDYDYAVTTYDRLEPGNLAYPPQAGWTEGPEAKVVLRKPPTVVFKLTGRLDPSSCLS
jgi:hypothetical protein